MENEEQSEKKDGVTEKGYARPFIKLCLIVTRRKGSGQEIRGGWRAMLK